MKKISIIFALALIATSSLQAFFGFGYGPGWGYGPYYGGYYGGGRGAAIATGAIVGAGLIGSAIAARHDRDYDDGDVYYGDGGTRYYYS